MDPSGELPSNTPPPGDIPAPSSKLVLALKCAAAVLIASLAIQMLMREFGSLSGADIAGGLSRIGAPRTALMVAATLAAFLAVATYDAFALGYAGRGLGLSRSALSSTTAYAVSNVLGFAVFTGNAVRFWLFRQWGRGPRDVAIAAVATAIVCNLALALVIGGALILSPDLVARVANIAPMWAVAVGTALGLVAVALILVGVVGPRTLDIGGLTLRRPGPLLLLQLCVCLVDYVATAGVLYIPLSDALSMDLPAFIAVFSAAKLAGIASNIPGGLGVFEAVMALSMVEAAPATLAAALIAYRVNFYLAPFAVAACALGAQALLHRPPPPDAAGI